MSFFLINYYQTNFHLCIPIGILLHFYSFISNYFSSPSSFCKLAGIAYQILSCSSFFREFTVPSVLYPLHETFTFLSFFQVYTYYSSFFLIRLFSIVHGMNIVVFCMTCPISSLLRHCYISIAAQCSWLKLIILIHISHKVRSLTHGLSVHPGLSGSVDNAYTDRCCQLPSGTVHDQVNAGPSTTSVQLTPQGCQYNYLCNLH